MIYLSVVFENVKTKEETIFCYQPQFKTNDIDKFFLFYEDTNGIASEILDFLRGVDVIPSFPGNGGIINRRGDETTICVHLVSGDHFHLYVTPCKDGPEVIEHLSIHPGWFNKIEPAQYARPN
jgi:hypothetical protein